MCSVVEDDFGDEGGAHCMVSENELDQNFGLPDEICKKCNESKVAVKLNLKEAQCRSCFLNYVRHKFRAALGSTKIVRRGSNVLLVFDGAPENITMFHMIKYAMEQEAYKRLHFNPQVLYIDDDFIEPSSLNPQKTRFDFAIKAMNALGFPSYYTSIASSGEIYEANTNSEVQMQAQNEKFKETLDRLGSTSSKLDFIIQTKKNLYKIIAQKLDCSYIFLSDIGIDLAKVLLGNIALGRGCSLASEIAFCDDRQSNTKIIRPLRDLNPNEVEHYLAFNNLTSMTPPHYLKDKPSIQTLTSKFIDDLQMNFPSTVSTVFRTGDKIGSRKNMKSVDKDDNVELVDLFDKSLKLKGDIEQRQNCVFCQSSLDYENSATLFAVEYSRIVSSKVNSKATDSGAIKLASTQIENDARNAVNGIEEDTDVVSIKRSLCHSCRNIFKDFE